MDGVNFSNPALVTREVSPAAQRTREEPGAVQPAAQAEQRVNEGPSTVTTLSPQGLELAQREAAPVTPSSAAASGSGALNATQQPTSPDAESSVSAARASELRSAGADEVRQDTLQQGSSGRLIDDASPNDEILRS